MKSFRTVASLIIALALPLLIGAKCGDGVQAPTNGVTDDVYTTVVDLVNQEGQAVHLFAPGEDFPCCRVTEGLPTASIRNISMQLQRGKSYTFRAGRNGTIVDTVSCKSEGKEDFPHSVYFSSGNLRCDWK